MPRSASDATSRSPLAVRAEMTSLMIRWFARGFVAFGPLIHMNVLYLLKSVPFAASVVTCANATPVTSMAKQKPVLIRNSFISSLLDAHETRHAAPDLSDESLGNTFV